MSLSSLIFVFLFLPIFMLIYFFLSDKRRRNNKLLFFSILFYSFGGIKYLLLILAMSLVGWFSAIQIENAEKKSKKKIWLILSVATFSCVLVYFKYTNFFLENVGNLFSLTITPLKIALPLGISFYTFKLISYVADVYMKKVEAEKDYFTILLFVILFPQVLQGPIARFSMMENEFYQRKILYSKVADGIYRFSVGLAKKTILADQIGLVATTLAPVNDSISSATTLAVWMGSLCYSMQLYLDFSAYTDMAIGLGKMLGFTFPENFNYPYVATSVRDFWHRWHITLSMFFRDYVYIPMGGNRVGSLRLVFNLLVVWMLTGLWHGASWNFVLWGLFYVPFILLENFGKKLGIVKIPRLIKHIYTILIFNFGWILFRFSNMNQLMEVIKIALGIKKNVFSTPAVTININNHLFLLIYGILACTPIFAFIGTKIQEKVEGNKTSQTMVYSVKTVICLLLACLSFMAMAKNSFTPFLYNQF